MPRQSLSELIESIAVDAYRTDEQITGFLTVFNEEVRVPCAAQVLDVAVEVPEFDVEGDERRGLVARCRRAGALVSCCSLMSASSPGRWRRCCTPRSGAGSGSRRSTLGARRAGAGPSREPRGQGGGGCGEGRLGRRRGRGPFPEAGG
ncbi:MAG: hypothetical protein ACYCST_20990 [Acidimicrobiales bacterium]